MKSAVEFIEDTLNKRLIHLSDEKIHIKHFVRTAKCAEVRKILETINKAKEREKDQLGALYLTLLLNTPDITKFDFEEWYNQNTKK